MGRISNLISVSLLCMALASLAVEGRGRNNGGNSGGTQRQAPAGTVRQNGNGSQRPGNAGQQPVSRRQDGNADRQRPAGNPPAGHRPGVNVDRHHAVDNGYRPSPHPVPTRPPQPHYHGDHHHGMPHRPMMPPQRPYHRPVPPPSFCPYNGCPVIRTILGVTLGTAINLSVQHLLSSGYTITGYDNDMVYLSNVMQLNYLWPNATLYYGTGGLMGSEFVYSTSGYDISRYNMVYSSLLSQYGNPVSVQNSGNGITTTWWGYNNQYVSLSYYPEYAANGSLRYYTVLSFGN